jgi:hypothetical protein
MLVLLDAADGLRLVPICVSRVGYLVGNEIMLLREAFEPINLAT